MWAAIGAGIEFARELFREWTTRRPVRERAAREKEYDRDVSENAQAAAAGDAATLSQDFEAERHAAIRRGDLPPGPADPAGELHRLP